MTALEAAEKAERVHLANLASRTVARLQVECSMQFEKQTLKVIRYREILQIAWPARKVSGALDEYRLVRSPERSWPVER